MPDISKPQAKYQSRVIAYPKYAFMVFMSLTSDQIKMLYPFEFIYTSYDEITVEAKSFRKHFSGANTSVDNECIIIPLSYHQDVPLLSEYWTQPNYQQFYRTNERYRLFLNFLTAPAFHLVLVTPRGLNGGREYLSAAMPIPVNQQETAIRHFMFGSDYPVDREANTAALYRPQAPYVIDWARKIVLPVEKFRITDKPVN